MHDSCVMEADFIQVARIVVIQEAPESGFHHVMGEPLNFVIGVEYSLSKREMAAFLSLVEDASTSSVIDYQEEHIIMDYYKVRVRLTNLQE